MIRIRLLFLLFFLASSYIFSDNRVLNLGGDGDYVQIPTSVWFNGDLTVEAWVCVKEYRSWSRLIDFGNGADQERARSRRGDLEWVAGSGAPGFHRSA